MLHQYPRCEWLAAEVAKKHLQPCIFFSAHMDHNSALCLALSSFFILRELCFLYNPGQFH